jgi:hypothetical protein
MNYPDGQPDVVSDSTPWGGSLDTSIQQTKKFICEPWERALCLEILIDNEPESLLTDDPKLLRCPRCGFEIPVEPPEEMDEYDE